MNIILTEIGYFGPLILFLMLIYLTIERNTKPRNKRITNENTAKHDKMQACVICTYIILWQTLNYVLNEMLKHIFRQARPKDIPYINSWDSPPNLGRYGMPSGHAQQVVSEATYIIVAFQNPYSSILSIIVAALTIYQRYIYQKHTAIQLAVGTIVGVFTGGTFYSFISNKL
jgi:membrane-associated phospholipid phosphatase